MLATLHVYKKYSYPRRYTMEYSQPKRVVGIMAGFTHIQGTHNNNRDEEKTFSFFLLVACMMNIHGAYAN